MISNRVKHGGAVAALAAAIALVGCGGGDGASDAGAGTGGAGGRGGTMDGGGTGGRSGGGTGGRASVPDAGADAFSLPDAFNFDGFSFDGFSFGMDGGFGAPCAAGVTDGGACTPGTDTACQPASGGFCFCQGGSWTCF